jgi:predicted acylesterase/phospholipase RssA
MRRRAFLRSAAGITAVVACGTPARGQFPTLEQRRGRTALVLSGGGSHGAYAAGAVAALVVKGGLRDGEPLPYDLVCGTSIGALNGYLVATAQYGRLREVWMTLANHRLATLKSPYDRIKSQSSGLLTRLAAALKLGRGMTTDLRGLLQSESISGLLATLVQPSDPVHIPLYVATTNLTRARAEIFVRRATTPDGLAKQRANDGILTGFKRTIVREATDENLRGALFASAAIPVAFDPVMIVPDGRGTPEAFVDGGVTHNVPIGLARRCAEQLDVIFVDPVAETFDLSSANVVQIGLGTFQTMQRTLLEYQVRLAYAESAIMGAVGRGRNGAVASAPDVALTVGLIRPAKPLPGNFMDFNDAAALTESWQIGYDDGIRGWQPFVPEGLTS